MPKVSVIIPAYNAEKFLSDAVASVVLQTFKDWECIIVDDGSTDNTLSLAKEWEKFDKRIKVLKLDKNTGLPRARNSGASVARGKYLAFLDADDIWHPYKLALSLKYLEGEKTHSLRIIGLLNRFFVFHNTTKEIRHNLLTPFLTSHYFKYWDALYKNIRSPIPSSLVIEKTYFEALNGFNPDVPGVDDFDFMVRATRLYKNAAMIYTPEIMLYYRIHDNQMTVKKWLPMSAGSMNIILREILQGYMQGSAIKRVIRRYLFTKVFMVSDKLTAVKFLIGSFVVDPVGVLTDEIWLRLKWRFSQPDIWFKPNIKHENKKFKLLLRKIDDLKAEVIFND